jgi:O-acetyl-ADP-ribose deacetylase (regulator of RNase III)
LSKSSSDNQRTHPPVAAAVQAGNAFVSGASLPSYDAAENDRQTREARSGPISAVEQSGVTQVALPAGGEGGRQP